MVRTLALVIAALTAACANASPGLMSFRECSSRPRSFPYALQIPAAPGALFYLRRRPHDRLTDIDAEVVRLLAILSRTPGLEGAPATAGEFAASAARLAPSGSDWRRLPEEWFDPAPDPPPSWLNAFCRAESDLRDDAIMQKLVQKVREGARVFAVIGGTHVVMQERALRSRLASKQR